MWHSLLGGLGMFSVSGKGLVWLGRCQGPLNFQLLSGPPGAQRTRQEHKKQIGKDFRGFLQCNRIYYNLI